MLSIEILNAVVEYEGFFRVKIRDIKIKGSSSFFELPRSLIETRNTAKWGWLVTGMPIAHKTNGAVDGQLETDKPVSRSFLQLFGRCMSLTL